MMRKLLTALLCLLLALALPFTSLAATEYTISAVPGDELASIEAAKDLLDVLSLRFLCGEQSGMFTVALNGTDALNLAMKVDGDGVYAECAALNDKAFYFSKDDIITQMSALMKASGAEGEMTVALAQGVEQVFAQLGAGKGVTVNAEANAEAQLAKAEEMFANDPALLDFCTGLLSKIQATEGEYADPAHDTANQMMTLTIANEDLLKLADSANVQKVMASNGDMTAEEAKAKFVKALDSMEISVPITVYTAGDDAAIVAFRIPMTVKGVREVTTTEDGKTTTETKEIDVAMDMNYDRLTSGQVAAHTMTVSAKEKNEPKAFAKCTVNADKATGAYDLTAAMSVEDDGSLKEVLSMKGALTVDADGDKGWLGMLASGEQMTIGYECAHAGETSDKSLAIYLRGDAVSILEPAASDRPLFTLKVKVDKDASEAALAAVNAATPENSTQFLQMTEKEQTTFLTELQTKGMQLLMNIMAQLPASVMNLFMGAN